MLPEVLAAARARVLRATVVICLLIAASNLVNCLAGYSSVGETVSAHATVLAAAWCLLWALAAIFPALTTRCLSTWRRTGVTLAVANGATVAVTGGVASPVLSLCMYAGWMASVVVNARRAMAISVMISGSLVAGYLLAGASPADIVSGPARHAAVTSAVLPVVVGFVGVLLTGAVNSTLTRAPQIVADLRSASADASTPAMAALMAGRSVLALPRPPVTATLTGAEQEIVGMLADGINAKQIALDRGVSIQEVRTQIREAKRKTGARTMAHLVVLGWDGRS